MERNDALKSAVGASTRAEYRALVSGLERARNDLAHGGTLLDGRSPGQAVELFARLRRVTETAWSSAERLGERWDVFAVTVITDDAGRVWAGPGADPLLTGTWHVITAANPDSAARPDDVNHAANQRLASVLSERGLEPIAVLGASPDGTWREHSLAISGLARSEACELGFRFGQVAVFEVTAAELHVVRCPDGAVMRVRPRDVPSGAPM